MSLIISLPETPSVSVATDDNFMFASSKYFCSLFFSAAMLLFNLLLYLVKSLNCLMYMGGIKLPFNNPFLKNIVYRPPVYPRTLHCHMGHTLTLQPIPQSLYILCHC